MNILLIGASGMIGSRILVELADKGHKVTAAARNSDRITQIDGITRMSLDVANLAPIAGEFDVIISALSPRNSEDARAEAIAFTQHLIKAGQTGARIIMVGGAGSLNLPDGRPVTDVLPEMYLSEANAMKTALELLKGASANWTVIAPSAEIAPGERIGVYSIGGNVLLSDSNGRSHISAEDFAAALVAEVAKPQFEQEIVTVGYTA